MTDPLRHRSHPSGLLLRAVATVVLALAVLVSPGAPPVQAATAPAVSGLAPASGPTTGGTVVTITGTGFTGATRVSFATANAAFTVIDDTTIEAVSPRRPAGNAAVRVTTPEGRSPVTAQAQFTYTRPPAPFITGITPPAGPTSGGTSVVIAGSGFTAATVVTIGGRRPISYTIDSATQITLVTPFRRAPGTVNIRITGPGGTSAVTPSSRYTYTAGPPPNTAPTVEAIDINAVEDELVEAELVGSDQDGQPLMFTIVDPPAHGSLGPITPTGCTGSAPITCRATVTYLPDADYAGPDAFTYQADDGVDDSAPAQVTVTVSPVNDPPTDLTLTPSSIAENAGPGAVVGQLSTTDVDTTDTHTYTLVPGAGDTDNALFTISGTELQAIDDLDFEASPTRSVRVRATDNGGESVERQLEVTVTDVVESFALRFGGSVDDVGEAVAVDSDGNSIVTGWFSGTIDFDPGPGQATATALGSDDVFLAKYGPTGQLLWWKTFGSSSLDQARSVDVDADGTIAITGATGGTTIDFGSGPLPGAGNNEVFVATFAPDGTALWSFRVGSGQGARAWSIAFDETGAVLVAGEFSGTADFDPGAGTVSLTGTFDAFVAKYDAGGGLEWAQDFGAAGFENSYGVAAGPNGDVVVTGLFEGTVDFDPGPGVANLTTDQNGVFVVKLTGSGAFSWARGLTGSLPPGVTTVVGGNGDVFLAGAYSGTVDFDPGTGAEERTSAGARDLYVLKLSGTGEFAWAATVGDTGVDEARDLDLDSSGNVVVTGDFQGSVDFDPGAGTATLTSADTGTDVFVASYAGPTGGLLWAASIGGAGSDLGLDLAVGSNDAIWLTGRERGTSDFDPGPDALDLPGFGGSDVFVVKLDELGRLS